MSKRDMTIEEKREWFRKTATDLRARVEFAESRALVIEPELHKQSTVRSIYAVEYLERGVTPRYDIPHEDIECVFLMPQIGGMPTVQAEGAEFTVDIHGLFGGVEWQRDIALDGRFQVAERQTEMLKNKFLVQEEIAGWTLIKTHASYLPSTQKVQARKDDGTEATAGSGKMNIFTINDIWTCADEIGIGGRKVTDIFLSPKRLGDLRAQVGNGALPEDMRKALWNNGQKQDGLAGLTFHVVHNKALVSDNKAYAFTQKAGYRYGVMPIRDRLRTYDDIFAERERKIGVKGEERIGMAVLDDKGLIEITF